MAKSTFDTAGLTGSFSKNNMNNQFFSLFQGDSSPLRPRAQSVPNMTIAVASALVEGFYQQLWLMNSTPLDYAGGNSSAISAPITNPRIDLLYLTPLGALAWVPGSELGSPVPPAFTYAGIPICYVYCKTTMVKIVNYEDKDAFPNEGYIYRDLRPAGSLGFSVLENRTSDPVSPISGRIWIRTDL